MSPRIILLVIMLLGVQAAAAEPASTPVSRMTVVGIYASKPGDTTVYCLLGGGACLVPKDAGTADNYIAEWLVRHSSATAVPMSAETHTIPKSTKLSSPAKHREVYIWIGDGEDALNVDLVREGYFAGKSMIDMVQREELQIERERKMEAQRPDPAFAEMMAKLREATPT